jgi:hypothetical protein
VKIALAECKAHDEECDDSSATLDESNIDVSDAIKDVSKLAIKGDDD